MREAASITAQCSFCVAARPIETTSVLSPSFWLMAGGSFLRAATFARESAWCDRTARTSK